MAQETASFMTGGKEAQTSGPSGGKDDGGPLNSLNQAIGSDGPLFYPVDIQTIDHYMIFSAYKEHTFQGSLESTKRTDFTKLGSVYLPMPSNLQTAYQQAYKEEAVGALGMALGGFVANNMEAISSASKQAMGAKTADQAAAAASAFGDIGKRAISSIGTEGGIGAALNVGLGEGTQIAAGALGNPIAGAALNKAVQVGTAIAGIARNPHMAVLYDSPQFRTFEFGFQMRPKNYQESLMIGRIIHFFKYYSHPEYKFGNHFFIYPNQFKIRFKYPEFLHRFGDCVLKSVAIDYHAEGTPLYYDAGKGEGVDLGDGAGIQSGRKLKAPAAVNLQLSFQEVKILTKKEIQEQGR